jgi:hypothetical protein
MILLELNRFLRDNYAFYDPSAPIRLTLVEPRGYAPRLTDNILRGLRGKILIDVEGKIDIEKGVVKNGEEQRQEERKEEGQEKIIIEEKKEKLNSIEALETKVLEKPKRKKKG